MNSSEEYSRHLVAKHVVALEDQIKSLKTLNSLLEHQHKNDECANTLLTAWMKEVRSIKLHGDFEVRMVFTSCDAANAFVRLIN